MKVAICDNDPVWIKTLTDDLRNYFHENGIPVTFYCFGDGQELIESNETFDIVFLDIEMQNMNGISAGKILKERSPKTIIFVVTAFNQYLDDAFELGAYRYLTKPLDVARLFRALDAAFSMIANREITVLCSNDKSIILPTCKIVYCENRNRKTRIITTDGDYYSNEKLNSWREKLNDVIFFTPHSSYIINFQYVVSFTRSSLTLKWNDCSSTVSISPKHQCDFRLKYFMFAERGN